MGIWLIQILYYTCWPDNLGLCENDENYTEGGVAMKWAKLHYNNPGSSDSSLAMKKFHDEMQNGTYGLRICQVFLFYQKISHVFGFLLFAKYDGTPENSNLTEQYNMVENGTYIKSVYEFIPKKIQMKIFN